MMENTAEAHQAVPARAVFFRNAALFFDTDFVFSPYDWHARLSAH
ncbi:hypothetical protein OKW49_008076 [Paraburkholderia youngii]